MRANQWVVVLVVLAAAWAGGARATAGGVDARGCHKPKNGAHHCHGKAERVKARAPGNEAPTEHERRMLRGCRGLANAGACLGYARP